MRYRSIRPVKTLMPRGLAAKLFFSALLFAAQPQRAAADPTGDIYSSTAFNLVDNYSNFPSLFDGAFSVPATAQQLSAVSELFQAYGGKIGGVEVMRPDSSTLQLLSWSRAGHVVEFRVKSTNSSFISSNAAGQWSITFDDIDLNASGPSYAPRAAGIYFAFRSGGSDLPYNPDPFLGALPVGTGEHPLDASRTVVYITAEGEGFDGLQFTQVNGNKLRISASSFAQFGFATLEQIVLALGLTGNVQQPPVIDEFVIGVLVTGLLPPGDYNGDGDVKGDDYLFWKSQFGDVVPPYFGSDGNGNGTVDAADYTVWRNNSGYTSPAGIGSSAPPLEFSDGSAAGEFPALITVATPSSGISGPGERPRLKKKRPHRKKNRTRNSRGRSERSRFAL